MTALTLQVFVDSIALLSGTPAKQSVFLYDTSLMASQGKGTASLVTACLPGQLLRWTITPLDLQAPAWISGIAFGPPPAADHSDPPQAPDNAQPWALEWSGYAPAFMELGVCYPYTLFLSFGCATGAPIAVTGPALLFPAPALPNVPEASPTIPADGVL